MKRLGRCKSLPFLFIPLEVSYIDMEGFVISARIKWKDSYLSIEEDKLFCIGTLPKTFTDDNIFQYCTDQKEFDNLLRENNNQEFIIINIYGIEF